MEVSKKKPAPGAPAAKEPAPTLASGRYRFAKAEALRKYIYNKTRKAGRKVNPEKKKAKRPLFVEKPFNKKTRVVCTKKRPNNYPVKTHRKRTPKCVKRIGAPRVRKSLQPGTILILLAGVHKGKRVVLLKALKSGLLLVTGPYKLNRVPLRRVHQSLVIATSSRLNLEKVDIPKNLDDAYFRRIRQQRPKKVEGDVFKAKKKPSYKPSEQRKADQITVDKQIFQALRAMPDRKVLIKYLRARFALIANQYPHKMKF